ncbi:hypothetical protein ACWDRB_55875 [Nonomuraea sp. NPDC003707]
MTANLIMAPAGLPLTVAGLDEVNAFFGANGHIVGLGPAFGPVAWVLATVFGAGAVSALWASERKRGVGVARRGVHAQRHVPGHGARRFVRGGPAREAAAPLGGHAGVRGGGAPVPFGLLAFLVMKTEGPLGLIGLAGWLIWVVWLVMYGIRLIRLREA